MVHVHDCKPINVSLTNRIDQSSTSDAGEKWRTSPSPFSPTSGVNERCIVNKCNLGCLCKNGEAVLLEEYLADYHFI